MHLRPQRDELARLEFRLVSDAPDMLVATRTRFHWDCLLTFVTYIVVVRRVQELTVEMITSDRREFSKRARKLDPNFLPRGMQKGRAVVVAYVADRVTPQARDRCEEPTGIGFAGFHFPAALDLHNQHVWCFTGTRILGGVYQSKLRFLVQRLLEPHVRNASWPRSTRGAFLTVLTTFLFALFVFALIPGGLVRRWLGVSAHPVDGTVGSTELVSGGNSFCVIADSQVRCWKSGPRTSVRAAVPISGLNHPRALAMTADDACALDDDGVKCWSTGETKGAAMVSGLFGATELIAASRNFCAVARGEVLCWRNGGTPVESMTGLRNPKRLVPSLFDPSFCALDNDGLKCFRYYDSESPPFYQPTLWVTGCSQVHAVSANEWANRVVLLDQGRLLSYYDPTGSQPTGKMVRRKRSFDGPFQLKAMQGMRGPRALIERSIYTYALDDDGLKRVDPGGKMSETDLAMPGGGRVHVDRGGSMHGKVEEGPQGPTAIWSGPDSYVYSRDEKGKVVLRASGWKKGKRDVFLIRGVADPKKVVHGLYEDCALDGKSVKCWQTPGL